MDTPDAPAFRALLLGSDLRPPAGADFVSWLNGLATGWMQCRERGPFLSATNPPPAHAPPGWLTHQDDTVAAMALVSRVAGVVCAENSWIVKEVVSLLAAARADGERRAKSCGLCGSDAKSVFLSVNGLPCKGDWHSS